MKKITVGIDATTFTRRGFLGGALAAGAALLPRDLAFAQTKLHVGTMKIGDLSPFFLAQVNNKTRVLGYPLGGVAPRLLIASYFSSEAWTQKNGDAVKAFTTALGRGIDAHNANPKEAKAMIAKNTRLKPEFLQLMALPAFERKILEFDLQPLMDVAFQYKLIGKKFPPREVISKVAMA